MKKTIIIDAMGSDSRPNAEILGSVSALKELNNITIILVGKEAKIKKRLENLTYNSKRLKIINAPEEVHMSESPIKALKEKKNSSLSIGLDLLKKGEGDAFISAGNTGAVMTHSLMQIGRIQKIQRPAIATTIPTLYGETILLDAGANADCKPEQLLQFAVMGDIYAKLVLNKKTRRSGC